MKFDMLGSSARLNNVELDFLAKNYGARDEYNKDTLKEMVRFILERFSFLAVDEIRKAYQMWASNEIKVDGGEMYGGSFNLRQLGKVLAAYNETRKKVLGNYLNIIHEEREQRQVERKQAEAKAKFEIEFAEIVMKAKETVKDWRNVPEYFYDAIQKRWPIQFEQGEKQQIWQDAQELAALEIKADESDSIGGGMKAILEARQRSQNFEGIAVSIAKKITIFRKVINNPEFKI